MMKKIINRLAKVFVVFLILLIIFATALIIIVPKVFPKEKIIKYVEDYSYKKMGRKLTIGDAKLNPFKGLVLKNCVMANDSRFKEDHAFKADNIILQYDLWPLIFDRRVV
ncbi:hypothetical protein ACFL56_03650, partial [Candidatus Margulisiibacteriota bacterium]